MLPGVIVVYLFVFKVVCAQHDTIQYELFVIHLDAENAVKFSPLIVVKYRSDLFSLICVFAVCLYVYVV